MSTFVLIPQCRSEYSENLLSPNSVITDQSNVIKVSGSALSTAQKSATNFFEKYQSIKVFNNSSVTPLVFFAQNSFDFVTNNDGNYILSLRVLHKQVSAFDHKLKVNIFANGIQANTLELSIADTQRNEWLTFAQSFNISSGVSIGMTFEFLIDPTDPAEECELWIGGVKMEYDDRNLGLPSLYTLPRDFSDIGSNVIFVNDLSDLPKAELGAITLEANKTYFIATNIDLLGNSLFLMENTTLIGGSSENCTITSTGLNSSTPLIYSVYSLPIRNIAIKDVGTALLIDGTGNPSVAIDWDGVNFVNVPNIGIIRNVTNFIFDKGSFLNSKGLIFDGSIGTVAINNSLLSGDGLSGNLIQLLNTCTITRRFRIIYSSLVASGSTIGVNVSASASIPNESYILDTVNFSGGGTYLSGVLSNDNKTLFVNCKGIANSNEISQYYMNGNSTATIIGATNTPIKVSGTTTNSSVTQKFTHTNNRATYVGSLTRQFLVTATLSLESGTNNQIGCYIAKNGSVSVESEVYGTTSGTGRAENITIQTLVELSTNDYIEIFVENATAINNILVTDLNVIVK